MIKIRAFSFKKMHLKTSRKWWPFCLDLNVLRYFSQNIQVSTPERLAYWGLNSMASILLILFANTFCWLKITEFQTKFHWNVILGVSLLQVIAWHTNVRPHGDSVTHAYMHHRPKWVNLISKHIAGFIIIAYKRVWWQGTEQVCGLFVCYKKGYMDIKWLSQSQ